MEMLIFKYFKYGYKYHSIDINILTILKYYRSFNIIVNIEVKP